MQIVLAGQPQLADRLASPSMAQLRQRVSMVIRIEPLTPDEVNAYIDHRLWIAGCEKTCVLDGRRSQAHRRSQRRHSAQYQQSVFQRYVAGMRPAAQDDRSRHHPRRDCGPGSRTAAREKRHRAEVRKEIGSCVTYAVACRKKAVTFRRMAPKVRDHQRSAAGSWRVLVTLNHGSARSSTLPDAVATVSAAPAPAAALPSAPAPDPDTAPNLAPAPVVVSEVSLMPAREASVAVRQATEDVRVKPGQTLLSNQPEQIWQVRRQGPRGIARTKPFARRSGPYSHRPEDSYPVNGSTIHGWAACGPGRLRKRRTHRGRKTMSKNFELMQQAGKEQALRPSPVQDPAPKLNFGNGHGNGNGKRHREVEGLDLDLLGRGRGSAPCAASVLAAIARAAAHGCVRRH